MFRSATFKLTLWYLAIAMTISICFSGVIYNIATHEIDRGLHRQSERIYSQIPDSFEPPRRLVQLAPDYNAAAERLMWRLVFLNIVVLAGAGYASYLLARRTLEPIEIAHEQQKRFTADVSHELRTPITAIKMEGEVALLNKKSTAHDLRKTIESSLEEATKLEQLINNLLRLSRLEAGELQQQFSATSSTAITDEAIERLAKTARSRGIKLESSVDTFELWGDRESLVQLLVIVLENAIKYSKSKQTVRLLCKVDEENAVIEIADSGSGIDPSALEHVFDRFYQAESSRKKSGAGGGYGLGLSIAKSIVDLHRGVIKISSQLERGTTVRIELPLHDSDAV